MHRWYRQFINANSGLKFVLLTAVLVTALFSFGNVNAQSSQSAVFVFPQEPGSLLPHFDLLTLAHEAQRLIFNCLFAFNETGDIVPDLAAEVPTVANGGISEDGTTYTIRLKEGVTWHDGEPFTSEDVRFTWQVITDPDLPIPTRVVWEDIESIETPDEHTAVINLPSTNVAFLATAATNACFILPEHLLVGTDIANSPQQREPVGTGPFEFAEWASGSFLRVTQNPEYFIDGLPLLNQITIQFIPGTAGQRAALERGDVDLQLQLTSSDFSFVESLPDYSVQNSPNTAFWLFWINNEDPILSDLAVRQALAHGLDKLAITETIFEGTVEPLDAVLPPVHFAHNPNVTSYEYDHALASQILEDAGWELGADGVREKDGQRLEIEVINIAGQAERLQVVQVAQSFWNEIGFDVSIREIEAATFVPTLSGGDFQLAYGFFGENPEPVFNLWLGTNWQRYANQAAFDILADVPSTIDREERRELIQEFQAIVAEDIPVLPLAPRTVLNAVHNRFQGYAPSLSYSLWNAATFSIETE